MLTTKVRHVVAAFLLALPTALPAQTPPAWDKVPLALGKEKPDVVLTGTVNRSDYQRNVSVPFTVPKGVTRIAIELTYTRPDGKTVINLGLFDGERFRGWSGSNKHAVVLDESSATPSFTAGPIGGRRWSLDLGVSYIDEGSTSTYTAKVWFWRKGDVPAVSTFSPEPLELGRRWYRGDLHLHTGDSDGFCDSRRGRSVPCPIYRTVEAAEDARLDFIAITDHNNVGHYNAMRELQAFYDDVLLIPGREMTTEQGHANIFGTTEYIDHRLGEKSMPDMASMVRASHDAGALVSINHPGAPSDYRCRGCGWTASRETYEQVDSIEVMNAGNLWKQLAGADPMADVAIWEAEFAKGRRITAIGGSDNHDMQLGRLGVGFPTTVVLADALSERAILDGIKKGHVWLDLTGKPGRSFDVTVRAPGAAGTIGDNLSLPAGQTLTIEVSVGGSSGGSLVGLLDGKPVPALSFDHLPSATSKVPLTWSSDGARHWIRFEVREGGKRILITNPVFLNFNSDR
ncbi:CehA/McbA family metallohydrolase [Sphingomonas xinjiangensis]|uniref:Putative metal-dependent phosphoesterase TrpH n=1 Tax=Sphingomonas xinjiangensis TaxID=643568 RepID=A0A840YTT0_9SPHN|nr:CehA/McbA family metallohydrolase [Sphingomonas xinjiangensis]MBB5713094.1 putative metal-dependent phosphoesterase TrpH [Sphingomonas xinjiangensis]